MIKVLAGGLVAGIVVFFWGSISHLALPIGTMGIRQIPGEEKVVAAVKESIHERGFYFFPGRDMGTSMSKSEEDAYAARLKAGPTGVLVVNPAGSDGMSPANLLTELGSSIVAGLLAAIVLTQVKSGYLGRVLVVTLMGVFGFVSINISYWNWYAFPTDYTIGTALDEIIGWFLGGLALAAIVRPARAPKIEVTE